MGKLLTKQEFLRAQFRVLGKIRLHPLFIALLIVAALLGLFREVAVLFVLVILHEIGHAAMANHLGYEVKEVSLLPFGGVAKLAYGGIGFHPRHEAAVAIAGPFVNLLLAVFAWAMYATGLWSLSFYQTVLQLNLWIAIFNLLPALPLDGGRILRAARSRSVGYEVATREAYHLAIFISILLLILGAATLWAGHVHVGILVLGVFLFVSAYAGKRDIRVETVRFLDAKKHQGHRKPQLIRSIAAPASNAIKDVVVQFAPDRYHIVYVLTDSGEVLAVIEEEEILGVVFQGRWLEPLSELFNDKI